MARNKLKWRPATAWLFIFALIVLHHDFWQWSSVEPILFGWMPVALWYHAAYSVLAILALYLLSCWAWPPPPETAPTGEGIPEHQKSLRKTSAEQTKSERGQQS